MYTHGSFIHYRSALWQLSAIYLFLPFLIFAFGWLRIWVALPVVLFSIVAFIILWQQGAINNTKLPVTTWTLVGIVSIAAGFLVLSGSGGWGMQEEDWEKHNAILKMLVTDKWPIYYRYHNEELPLIYYMAYYLPAALVGQWVGWFGANQILFLWSLLGLILALLWFCVLVNDAQPMTVLLFFLFSGLDLVGNVFIMLQHDELSFHRLIQVALSAYDLEWWAHRFQYSAPLTQLFWVPHQALAGWILTGMIISQFETQNPRYDLLAWLWSVALLWSPFVALGVFPFLGVDLITRWRSALVAAGNRPSLRSCLQLQIWTKQIATVPTLSALFNISLLGLFFAAKVYPANHNLQTFSFGLTLSNTPTVSGWILFIGLYFLFCLLEFGLFALLIIGGSKRISSKQIDDGASTHTPPMRDEPPSIQHHILRTAIFLLALLPLIRYGSDYDLTMRASIPALFILNIYFVRMLYHQPRQGLLRYAFAGLILASAMTPFFVTYRHIDLIVRRGTLFALKDVEEESLARLEDWQQALYLGNAQHLFFQWFARK